MCSIQQFTQKDLTLDHVNSHSMQYTAKGSTTQNIRDAQMKLSLADELGLVQGLLHICSYDTELQSIKDRSVKVAVIVAGAAPGEHLVDLAHRFDFLDFYLYDQRAIGKTWNERLVAASRAPNNNRSDATSRITLHTKFLLQDTAAALKVELTQIYQHVIFLCDLRTGDAHSDTQVTEDMKLQRQLTLILNPCYSVLKFRLPYNSDKSEYEYLDGQIYFESFPPRNSTETRLHVTDTTSSTKYNPNLYENQLYYHNQVTRNVKQMLFTVEGKRDALSYDDAHRTFVRALLTNLLKTNVPNSDDKFDRNTLRALLRDLQQAP
jgi:hypothetical protein